MPDQIEGLDRRKLRASLWTIVGFLPRVSPLRTGLLAAGIVVNATLSVGFTLASGALVGAVPEAVQGGFTSPQGRHMVLMVALASLLFVADQVLSPFLVALISDLGRGVNLHVGNRVIAASLAPAGIAHLEDPEFQDKLENARRLGPTRQSPHHAVEGLAGIAGARLLGVFYFIVVAQEMPLVALVLTVMWIVVHRYLRRDFLQVLALLIGGAQRLRRASYYRFLGLGHEPAKEVRLFGLGDWIRSSHREKWLSLMRGVWRERSAGARRRLVSSAIAVGVSYFVAFVLIARGGIDGALSLGEVTVLASSVFGLSQFGTVDNNVYQVEYGGAVIPRLRELEEAADRCAQEETGGEDATGLPTRGITFEGVSFRYPGRSDTVFDGLDLNIEAGTSLAIVGQNGAGKTTLVKLLARLHEPQSGRIAIDGVDLARLDTRRWQRRIGAIFQDFTRYPLPARENVGFGAPGRIDDQPALEHAAGLASARETIDRLSKGWDTILDRGFTDGADLSGGEWQKIALARALFAVHAGAGILVLDEPTANLDARAEAEVYDRFLDMTRGRTTIVISHRFSTVRRADRIIVLDDGRVIEDGTHDELVALGGRYAHMFALQAARFSEGTDDA